MPTGKLDKSIVLPVKTPEASSSDQVPPASSPFRISNKSKALLFNAGSFSQKGAGLLGVPVLGRSLIMI